MSEFITRGISIQKSNYEKSVRELEDINIDDYYKVLEVLKLLSSNELVQYEIKTLTYPTFDYSERHGYRSAEEYTGEITILAEKEALSKLVDISTEMSYLTKDMLREVYQQGFSMILVGNDRYRTELNLPNQRTLGYFYPIVFYLQDDELAIATSSFMSFIEENGTDLEQIKIDDLVQTIKSKYQKQKKLI